MITAQNNLPSVSQRWAQQVATGLSSAEKEISSLRGAVNRLSRQASLSDRAIGHLNVKVVQFDVAGPPNPLSENLYMQASIPVDLEYDYMAVVAQFQAREDFYPVGSSVRAILKMGFQEDGFDLISASETPIVIPAGATGSRMPATLSTVYDYRANDPKHYTPYVYATTTTRSVVSGYVVDSPRLFGHIVYFKEQS